MLSGQASHSKQQSFPIHCAYCWWQVLWRQSRLYSWVSVEDIKVSIKCLYFNLTHSTHLNTAADQGTGSGTVSR